MHDGGSYWPCTFEAPNALTIKTGPGTQTAEMSGLMSPDTYANHKRQDRPEGEFAALTSPSCSHWKSIGAEAFRVHTPPGGPNPKEAPNANPHIGSPVLPSPQSHTSGVSRIVSTSQFRTMVGPKELEKSSPRRRAGNGEAREGSREYLISCKEPSLRDGVDGTSKITKIPPGYMGHIPHVLTNSPKAVEHGTQMNPRISQRCKEDTLFDSFNERPIGYMGYAPTTVFNRRTWTPQTRTTAGASDLAMVGMGHKLKKPEAAGESAILSDFFAGPLDGRPSDNGQFEAQVFYGRVRPFEGAPRPHWPSGTHPTGRKFMNASISTKNWGNVEASKKL